MRNNTSTQTVKQTIERTGIPMVTHISTTFLPDWILALGPTTTIIEDTDDKKGWSTITQAYNSAGVHLATVTLMDDGSAKTEVFAGFQRISLTVTDTDANKANWSSRTTEWTVDGAKSARTTVFDDGDRLVERYDAVTGLRTHRTEHDDSDSTNWQSLTTRFDATGKIKVGIEKVLDNGRILDFTYDADSGDLTSRSVTDGGDKHSWHSKTLNYDSDTGKLASRQIVEDDGASWDVTWINGKRASSTRLDGSNDTFEWRKHETLYDSNGKTALVTETRDDDDLIVSTYFAGRLADTTTYDNSGDEVWHIERITYDPDGEIADTQYYDDSGNILLG